MTRRLACASLLLLLAPSALAAQGDDAAWLVPSDATVLVRLESARAWNELVHAFAPVAGDAAAQYDLQSMLNGMAAPGASPAVIDPSRPLYLALSLGPGVGPSFTLALPAKEAQFQLQSASGPTTSVVRGEYTGVSNRAGYAASATPSPLLAALRPGLVSVHLDLGAIIRAFRPLIDMGLDQAEAMVDQAQAEETPFDIQPLMEAYLGAARKLIDSAQALDLALERHGDELALRFDYVGSAPSASTAAVTDITALLGCIDQGSAFQLACNGRWPDYFALFGDMVETVLEVYPEPLRSDLQTMMRVQGELGPLFLPGLVAGFDFGPEGMHGAYVVRSSDPGELRTKLEELLRALDHEGGFVRVGPVERMDVEGLEAHVLALDVEYEALLRMMADMNAGASEVPPEAEEQFRAAMDALYGRDLRLALVPVGEMLGVCVGNDEGELRAAVARLKNPAASAPRVLGVLAAAEPGDLALAYHVDVGRTLGQLVTAMQGVLPGPHFAWPERELSFDVWGSTGGPRWSGGMTMTLSEYLDFARAVQDLEGK